jgi:hypothetical protein
MFQLWGFDHDRHGHGDGDRGGMAIMIKVEAEDTIKARAEYMTAGINRYTREDRKGRFWMKLK